MEDHQDNWQQQWDELVALQSIYGDAFRLACISEGGELSHPALPDAPPANFTTLIPADGAGSMTEFEISVDVGSANPTAGGPSSEADNANNDEANSLSPQTRRLTMCLKLPPSYPSHDPPQVKIKAHWLKPGQISDLVQQLLRLWSEQGPGGPICFTWVDWLQNDVLPYLDSNATAARKLDMAEVQEKRKAAHIAAMDLEAFNKRMWQCMICFDDIPGSACVRLPDCGHYCCITCMRQDWRIKINSGTQRLKCPGPFCQALVPPEMMQDFAEEDDYAKWESMVTDAAVAVASPNQGVGCPRCKGSVVEDEESRGACKECTIEFCSLRGKPWHKGRSCMDAHGWAADIAQQRGASADSAKQRLATNMVNEMINERAVRKMGVACPNCKIVIQKSGGCNQVECSMCNTVFCYKCGKTIDGHSHYRCKLFAVEDEDDGVAQRLRQALQDQQMPAMGYFLAKAAAADGRTRRCPTCRQPNLKEGRNNVLSCWSCSHRFCYCCGESLQGKGAVTQHYNTAKVAVTAAGGGGGRRVNNPLPSMSQYPSTEGAGVDSAASGSGAPLSVSGSGSGSGSPDQNGQHHKAVRCLQHSDD